MLSAVSQSPEPFGCAAPQLVEGQGNRCEGAASRSRPFAEWTLRVADGRTLRAADGLRVTAWQ